MSGRFHFYEEWEGYVIFYIISQRLIVDQFNISESAMGKHFGAQSKTDSDYVKAVYE